MEVLDEVKFDSDSSNCSTSHNKQLQEDLLIYETRLKAQGPDYKKLVSRLVTKYVRLICDDNETKHVVDTLQ